METKHATNSRVEENLLFIFFLFISEILGQQLYRAIITSLLMNTFLIFNKKKSREIPEKFRDDDNRTDEGVVEYFINKFTKPGDTILDCFAGLGTTLFIAEEMGRVPYGIELDEERFLYVKESIQSKENLFLGNSLNLSDFNLPQFDFSFSSPIFMGDHETKNPLDGYKSSGDYSQYLQDIRKIYENVKRKMKPNSFVIIEVANFRNKGKVTTLAWDIAKEVSKIMHFVGEIIINWDLPKKDTEKGLFGGEYDHHYCLIFRNIKTDD